MQIVTRRDVQIEPYALVASPGEAIELKNALEQCYPDRMINVVDLCRVREASTNE